jgi:hypothetical protein
MFKMRGLELKSKQTHVDAFFELQRKRKTVSGDVVWDTVFRSWPVEDSDNPVWDFACIELSTLCKGKKDETLRVAIKDYGDGDIHSIIGYFRATVNELLAAATDGAGTSNVEEVNTDKAIVVMKGKDKQVVGKVVVISASISDAEEEEEVAVEAEPRAVSEEEDIVIEATDEIEILPDELFGGPNFADYISGGCQLRVIVAIDYTASNGTLIAVLVL